MDEYYINPIFPFVSPMKSHNICYVKTICSSIYTCFILYPYLFNFHTPYCDNICIFYTRKSIHVCFSLKTGRSDMTS